MSDLQFLFKSFENDDKSFLDFINFKNYYNKSNESLSNIALKIFEEKSLSLQQELLLLFLQINSIDFKNKLVLNLKNYLKIYKEQNTSLIDEFYEIFKDYFQLNTLEIVLGIIKVICDPNKIYNEELFALNVISEKFVYNTDLNFKWNLHCHSEKFSESFKTNLKNLIDFLDCNLKQSSVTPTSTQETTVMTTLLNTATTALSAQTDLHKDAAIQASLQEVGKIAIKTTKEMIKPHLPPIAAAFIDHDLADLVIASGISVVLTAVKPTDKKALAISKAVLVVGYSKAIGTLQIPQFVSKLITTVPDSLTEPLTN